MPTAPIQIHVHKIQYKYNSTVEAGNPEKRREPRLKIYEKSREIPKFQKHVHARPIYKIYKCINFCERIRERREKPRERKLKKKERKKNRERKRGMLLLLTHRAPWPCRGARRRRPPWPTQTKGGRRLPPRRGREVEVLGLVGGDDGLKVDEMLMLGGDGDDDGGGGS